VLLFPLAALLGVIAGSLFGGRPGALAGLRFRAPGILFGALAVQLALGVPPFEGLLWDVRAGLVVLSYAALGVFFALNAAHHHGLLRAGLVLMAAGWLLNLAAIVPNGGMPVSRAALARVGAPPDLAVEQTIVEKHVPAGRRTSLGWLGDVIPVPALRAVISAGDVLLLAGVAVAVAGGTASRPRGRAPGGAVAR
jgi:hypothetical protein